MSEHRKTPVLKWAGGKTQLLEALQARMPESYSNYYEPFIGGGALFLSVSPHKAIINDTNEQLINLYRQLKNAHRDIIHILSEWDAVPCDRELYLSMRSRYNEKIQKHELDPECAALMIWLNKHCFNGLPGKRERLVQCFIQKRASDQKCRRTFFYIFLYDPRPTNSIMPLSRKF